MTNFSEIYPWFNKKITDYKFQALSQANAELIMDSYILSASARFDNECRQDLTVSGTTFPNATLTPLEFEIIAEGSVLEWMRPHVNSIDWFEKNFTPNELRSYSPAEQLKVLADTFKLSEGNLDSLKSGYGYRKTIANLG